MTRLMIVWMLISLGIGAYRYFLSRQEKRNLKQLAFQTVVSMTIGLLLIFGVMQLNNLSGI